MTAYKASTPRRGADRASEAETANTHSVSDNDQDHGLGTATGLPGTRTTIRPGRADKRFDNDPNHRVHRHQKTLYVYRIGIRLPKEKLQQFPRYNGKVSKFLEQWRGPFVTLNVPRLQTILFLGRNIPPTTLPPGASLSVPTAASPSAASLPSLLSAAHSVFSEVEAGLRTPITAQPSPQGDQTNRQLSHQLKGAEQELLVATTGSYGTYEQTRLSPCDTTLATTSPPFDSSFLLSSQTGSGFEDLPVSERLIRNHTMAPVKDTSSVHKTITDVAQHLTDIQIQTHGYIPSTQDLLIDRLTDLTQSLAHLKHLTSPHESPNNYIHQVAIAPEIVDYVDDGRNPDIFTRDFVEIVQRGNAVINGKQQAFREFTEVFAQKLKEGIPGVSGQVDRVLKNAGFDEQEESRANGEAEGGARPVDGHENNPANG